MKLLTKNEKITIDRFENMETADKEIGIDRIVDFFILTLKSTVTIEKQSGDPLNMPSRTKRVKVASFLLQDMERILGASVVNDTGMKGIYQNTYSFTSRLTEKPEA